MKPVTINGVEYRSMAAAAAAHGCVDRASRDRFARDYHRALAGRRAKARPVIIDGVEYPSQTAAAAALGVTRQAIHDRIKRGKL